MIYTGNNTLSKKNSNLNGIIVKIIKNPPEREGLSELLTLSDFVGVVAFVVFVVVVVCVIVVVEVVVV